MRSKCDSTLTVVRDLDLSSNLYSLNARSERNTLFANVMARWSRYISRVCRSVGGFDLSPSHPRLLQSSSVWTGRLHLTW
jgi:hypothetical protein